MGETLESLLALLAPHKQEHLVEHWHKLSDSQKSSLSREIRRLDFDQLAELQRSTVADTDWHSLSNRAEPPPAVRLADVLQEDERRRIRDLGEEALACGRIGVILVAGGQGTRLGFDDPKGMFKIGPLSNRSLFEMHIDRLTAVMNRYDVAIPMYVMTSPLTDEATRTYFQKKERFGLDQDQLILFCQGTMPAVDEKTGRVLLSSLHEIALSPDGHGGMLQALSHEGCLQHARDHGIDHFFYAQVDNPLVQLCDPELIGHHLSTRSQMTTQVVQKRFGKEKVGNVVQIDRRVAIIEYSDLPDSAAEKKAPDGSLLLWAGNIAVHILERSFLEQALSSASLPFHRASKVVPTIDSEGNRVNPTSPNAVKFERFIFDLLPMAERAIVVEGDASQVFAPVKNADGAPSDTPAATKAAIVELARKWLKKAGAKVGAGVQVEINPRWALDEDEVATKISAGVEVSSDTYFSC